MASWLRIIGSWKGGPGEGKLQTLPGGADVEIGLRRQEKDRKEARHTASDKTVQALRNHPDEGFHVAEESKDGAKHDG